MIKQFEVGKYYRYIGGQFHSGIWNTDMSVVLDGKPRRCIATAEPEVGHDHDYACLEGIYENKLLYWGDLRYFEEVHMEGEGLHVGDIVDAWDDNEEYSNKVVFLAKIDGIDYPFVTKNEFDGPEECYRYKHVKKHVVTTLERLRNDVKLAQAKLDNYISTHRV